MINTPKIVIQIIHIEGPLKGQIQEFSEQEINIGRLSSCHVRFPKDLAIISRQHASIVREGNRFKLIDQSANGTYVNGKRVNEHFLKDGDVLMFAEGGPKVSFLSEIKEEQPDIEKTKTEELPAQPEIPVPEIKPTPFKEPEQFVVQDASVEKVKASLIIQYGPTIKAFEELPVTVGKAPGCDLVLTHPSILDNHVQFFYSRNQYWMKDLTGKNLLSLNGQPVDIQACLTPDSTIALSSTGPSFRFIEGGRLLEIDEPVLKEPAEAPAVQEDLSAQGALKNDPLRRGKALFKKVLTSLGVPHK